MLTVRQDMARKRLLTKIHTCKEYKNIKAYDAWEEWLEVRYGVPSCKELSIGELKKVVDELVKGVVYETQKPDFKGRMLLKEKSITGKQLSYMMRLWEDKSDSKDEISLLKFTSKVIKKQYLYLTNLTQEEATNVISVLERKL